MTPEDIAKVMEEARHKETERKKDEEDRFFLRGKHDPLNKPVGTCVVCRGNVVEKLTRELRGDLVIGPGSRNQAIWVKHGFFCKNCGLRYEFPPPSNIVVAPSVFPELDDESSAPDDPDFVDHTPESLYDDYTPNGEEEDVDE